MTLCAVSDVQNYLGNTDAALVPVFTTLVANASAFIERYCGRVFEQGNYTETRNGNGADSIYLRQGPIISVQSVSVDGVSMPAAPDAISYGYVFDEHKVYLRGYARVAPSTPGTMVGSVGSFRRGIQNVVIAYTAGYATIPLDLNQACIELVADKYAKRKRIDEKSQTTGQQMTASYDMSDISARVKTAINAYRLPMYPP